MKVQTKTISVRLPAEEAEALSIIAKASGTSISECIRAVLHAGIIIATDATGLDLNEVKALAEKQLKSQEDSSDGNL